MKTHSAKSNHPSVGRHPDRSAHTPIRGRARPSEEPSDVQAGGFSSILRRYPATLGITLFTGAILLTVACLAVHNSPDPTAWIPYGASAALLLTALCGGITAGKLNPSSTVWAGGLCGCLSAALLTLAGLILGGGGFLPWLLRLSVIPLHLLGSAVARPRKRAPSHRAGDHRSHR